MMFKMSRGEKLQRVLLLGLIAVFCFASCDDDNMVEEPGFDRGALLESVASNLIIPNFESLQASVTALAGAADAFTQTASEDNLTALRTAWNQAAIDHQYCSAFGFGPADLPLGAYAEVLGAFPTNEEKIEQNVLDPDFDLPNSFDRDVRGFYAVEYLVYGSGLSDAEIIAGFDQNRKDYLLLIVEELQTTFDNIVNEWTTTYKDEFVGNTSTAAGSPTSLYYNGFIKDYENLKNFKVELPAGLTADQAGPDGTLVEAFYSGISRELLEAHFANSKNIYLGLSRSGEDIIGFDDYLDSVVGGPELVTSTKEAITQIDNAIAALPSGRLSDNVGNPALVTLRDELQSNTANFKSSIVSLLGLTITFNSGDGD